MNEIIEMIEKELNIFSPKLYPILDITQPILIAMNNHDNWYLIYVLQDRIIRTKDKKRIPVLEILVTSSDIESIKKVALGEKAIRAALLDGKVYRMGKIANKGFEKKLVENQINILDKLPKEGFCLKPIHPNRVIIKDLIIELNGWQH